MNATFEDLTEVISEYDRPPLDRRDVNMAKLDAHQQQWHREGYVIIERFMPSDLIDAYCAVRERAGQWPTPTPYMEVKEIRDLCCHRPLLDKLKSLVGSEVGLHLNLTNWTSTERNWHQDDYLNPPTVNGHYAAVWMALDDIHPDSGPFQYVPGSHRWPVFRGEKVRNLLLPNDASRHTRNDWPMATQDTVSGMLEDQIKKRGAKVHEFIARKGDVLIWHSCLVHRGSEPRQRGMPRKTLISHYTAIEKGEHFPAIKKHGEGWCFWFGPRYTNRAFQWLRRTLRLKHRIN